MLIRTIAELTDFMDHVRSVFDYRPQWWRGHGDTSWALVPAVHRAADRGPYEHGITTRFIARARPRYPNPPARGDMPSWLSLVQHYGLPTRLLDWTESALFGLHFALRNHDLDQLDGALWALDPSRLNQEVWGAKGTLSATAPGMGDMFDDVNRPSTMRHPDRVAALTPDHADPRMQQQLSSFTIHGPQAVLECIPGHEAFLQKATIPANAKSALRKRLRAFGITDSYLFPDLEHLAREERSSCFCGQVPCPHRKD